MRTTVRRAAALSLVALLAACAGGEPTPDRFYRLDVPPAAVRFERPLFSGVVEVAPLLAEGLVSDRAIVYLYADEPYELHQYSYQFWNTPPAVAVQEQLIRFLRSANVAERVVSTDLRLSVDLAIEGRVRRFDQVFDGKVVRMAIELEIAIIRSKDEKLTLLKVYRAETPAQDDSLPAAAMAASAALSEIFASLLADLRSARPTS